MPNDPSVAQLEDQKGFLSTQKFSEHLALKNEIQQRINRIEKYQKTKEFEPNKSLKQMFMTRLNNGKNQSSRFIQVKRQSRCESPRVDEKQSSPFRKNSVKTGEMIMNIKSPKQEEPIKSPSRTQKYSEKQKQLFSIYCAQPSGSKLAFNERKSNFVQKKRQMSREVNKHESLSGLELRAPSP